MTQVLLKAAFGFAGVSGCLGHVGTVGSICELERKRAVLASLHTVLNTFLSHWICRLNSGVYCKTGRDGRPYAEGRPFFAGSDGDWAVSGHSGESLEQTNFLFEVSTSISPRQICEVGFNAGHSALTLLVGAGGNSSYLGFDWSILNPGLNEELFRMIRDWLPANNMTIVWGDAHSSIRAFLLQGGAGICELIVFDGPHDVLQVLKFMPLLRVMAKRSRPFLFLDDVGCVAAMCHHSTLAWRFLLWLGMVSPISCRVALEHAAGEMGACLGRFQWGQVVRCQTFDARCVARTLGMAEQLQWEHWARCCLEPSAQVNPDAYLVHIQI
ncbi:unnamed protein product [Symbiodinium microadriaticum]|nr:unnamed protein product [Symbiodinium microadriaticum]CAE7189168.1 unnamed protein product [Symbiodinium sp. KB8]